MAKKQDNNKNNFNPMKNIGGNIIIWILIMKFINLSIAYLIEWQNLQI